MNTDLPIISAAGHFNSRDKFSDPEKYHDNSVTRLRTVVEYELELFTQDGGISHINGSSYPIKKGDILLACPGDKRQSTLHFTALYLHFGTTDETIQNLIHSISGYHAGMGYENYAAALSDICDTALLFDVVSDMDATGKLISFLCELKRNILMHSWNDTGNSSHSIVTTAITYMKQHYTESLTVDDIAEHCCLSSSHFYRIFSDNTNTTPNTFLTRLRLSSAKTLLATTTMPISDISAKCGFNSQAYFSDCFKKQLGITPREFRSSFVYPDKE